MSTQTLKVDATFEDYLKWVKNAYNGNNHVNSVNFHIETEQITDIKFDSPKGYIEDQTKRRGLLQEITQDGVQYVNGNAYFENACLMLEQRVKEDQTIQRIDANYDDEESGVKLKLIYQIIKGLFAKPNKRIGVIKLEKMFPDPQ